MGHKILLADDSITVQKIVKLTFSDEGIEVVAVGNGELALQQLTDWQPDLVLADVFMPGRDGYEVCQHIKTHSELCHIPVILLVHAFEPFDQARAAEVRADQHLTKPFHSIRSLVTTVKELIQSRANSQPAAAPVPAASVQTASAFSTAAVVTALPASELSSINEPPAASFSAVSLAEPAPLAMQSEVGFGEVMELEPQPEVKSSQPVGFAPPGNQVTQTGEYDFSESGQLLAFGGADGFGHAPGNFPPDPEILSEPETIPLVPEATLQYAASGDVLTPDPVFSSSPPDRRTQTGAEVMMSAEVAVPAVFASPVVEYSSDEVLDLEEVLPQIPLVQVGEVEFLSEPPSAFALTASAVAPPTNVDYSLPLAEPDELPILAEVADEGGAGVNTVSDTVADAAATRDLMSRYFTGGDSSSDLPPDTSPLDARADAALNTAPLEEEVFPMSAFGDMRQADPADLTEVIPVPRSSAAVPEATHSAFAPEVVPVSGFEIPAADSVATHPPATPLTGAQNYDYGMGQVIEEPEIIEPEVINTIPAATTVDQTVEVSLETSFIQEMPVSSPVAGFVSPAAESQVMPTPPGEHCNEMDMKQDSGVGIAGVPSDNTVTGGMTAPAVSPALIDEIVNRVVARMSEKTIQEIAWEVVPEMAEIIIRKQLTEKSH